MTAFAMVLGLFCFVVGSAKLVGSKSLADQFEEFGLGSVSMRIVGLLEVAAAIGLQLEGFDTWAAAAIVVMMLGAIFQHRRVQHPMSSMVPASALLVASAVFAYLSS